MILEVNNIDKILKAGFEVVSLLEGHSKTNKFWVVNTCTQNTATKQAFNKKKDAIQRCDTLLKNPLAVTDSLTKDDRKKLINKGFTFYRLRADHSIWLQNVETREWKQFSRYTAEDQANKALAGLLEDDYAIED